jgi:hypothetical protein
VQPAPKRSGRLRTFLRALALSLLCLACLLVPNAAAAGPFEVNDTSWEGGSEMYEIAKTELGPDRVKPVAVLDWSVIRPDDGVLLLHPLQTIDAGEASEFLKQGGRLGVIDDFGKGDEILRRFKIQRTSMPRKPVAALRNNPDLAIAEPYIDPTKPGTAPHPVVGNVKRLVLNHPSALIHPDLSPVLKVRCVGEPDAIVAVAGQVGKGRLFAMGDPSALINEMLRYPGNRAFAAGLVRYLANGDEKNQARLFILTNKFNEEGAIGGDKSIAKDVESFLQQLADDLAEARQKGLPPWALAVIAAIFIAGIGIWVARSSGRPYRNPTPRYARPTPLVARGGVAGRFALLAAPASPKSLVLLELKSAAMESLIERFGLESDPSTSNVVRAVRASSLVDDALSASFEQVIRQMQRTEAVVVAGGQTRVSRETLAHAAEVIQAVLHACGADRTHADVLGKNPLTT